LGAWSALWKPGADWGSPWCWSQKPPLSMNAADHTSRVRKSLGQRLCDKFRHGLIPHVVLDNLRWLGLEIMPWGLVLEDSDCGWPPGWPACLEGFEFGYLTPDELPTIAAVPDQGVSGKYVREIYECGCQCMAARKRGRIVAFVWANYDSNQSRYYPLRLERNEAFIFHLFTSREYRGMGLAWALRKLLMDDLRKKGYVRFYSTISLLNRSVRRLTGKTGGRIVRKGVFVELFWRYRKSFVWPWGEHQARAK
jgi:hypothetical protein